ncbi:MULTISPECIES: hypothetical protein [unclassified Streptomyces]|uniref:hypothetical protein n=1 Tax=unclassified Streptomyces TaxID=2593676 RepID=UPI0022B63C31|nr:MULTISPECIES: hypothetical protein [unclassified Streptomyces]MCZ7413515.1 hypothetical protein [Streptomyces sp. WMMC897]MCZ7430509.1 hypothetical protein [Streptomyces sp. WMMC1477]
MPRRVSLPAADELFRTTGGGGVQPSAPQPAQQPAGPPQQSQPPGAESTTQRGAGRAAPAEPRPAGESSEEHSGRDTAGPTAPAGEQPHVPPAAPRRQPPAPRSRSATAGTPRRARAPRRPSGRERHDEKITVYVSAEELMDLEHARLVLRGEHGLAVDRGRIVREAVAVVLADLEARGDASILVRRLSGN